MPDGKSERERSEQDLSRLADNVAAETSGQEELLRRILTAVERPQRRGGLEVTIAIILSVATLGSTWCGYQSRQWSGIQSGSQAAADTAERKAAEDTIVALQLRSFDGMVLLSYWEAMRADDAEMREAIFARMRPVLQTAMQASLAAGALHDPKVAGPLQRPEYVLDEEKAAARMREQAARASETARSAGRHAGTYVLLTLMFASVLFFGGITQTFSSRKVRMGLGVIAVVLFLITAGILVASPVCPVDSRS